MGCLLKSGGCERGLTDALVHVVMLSLEARPVSIDL